MKAALANALMTLAERCLGARRSEWAHAMRAELEIAVDGGQPCRFAAGCLIAALRQMPDNAEGRFSLVINCLAIALVVPMAGLLVSSLSPDFPNLYTLSVDVGGGLASSAADHFAVTDANRAAVPSMAILIILLSGGQLGIAWTMLERDWERLTLIAALNAAATTTLAIFASVLFMQDTGAVVQAVLLTIELAMLWILARWHRRLRPIT